MNTYNIYRCKCGYLFDAEHAVTVSIKAICPECGLILEHIEQTDMCSLNECYHEH